MERLVYHPSVAYVHLGTSCVRVAKGRSPGELEFHSQPTPDQVRLKGYDSDGFKDIYVHLAEGCNWGIHILDAAMAELGTKLKVK